MLCTSSERTARAQQTRQRLQRHLLTFKFALIEHCLASACSSLRDSDSSLVTSNDTVADIGAGAAAEALVSAKVAEGENLSAFPLLLQFFPAYPCVSCVR